MRVRIMVLAIYIVMCVFVLRQFHVLTSYNIGKSSQIHQMILATPVMIDFAREVEMKSSNEKFKDMTQVIKSSNEKFKNMTQVIKSSNEKFKDMTQVIKSSNEKFKDMTQVIKSSNEKFKNMTQEEKLGLSSNQLNQLTSERFQERNKHISEICKKYEAMGDPFVKRRRTENFFINNEYGLAYCAIFKAASSTWLRIFGLLAGYTDKQLEKEPVNYLGNVRKRYRRPSLLQLTYFLRNNPHPITFMAVRHPLTRLVSQFRDKILRGVSVYRPLAVSMMRKYPELKNQHPADWHHQLRVKSLEMPTFAQLAQYITEEYKRTKRLDMHLTPMNDFCTPCTNNFDFILKVETMEEDGRYIRNISGIDKIISSKVINSNSMGLSDEVDDYYICQLTKSQLDSVVELYKYDFHLFTYDTQRYYDCVAKIKGVPSQMKTLS